MSRVSSDLITKAAFGVKDMTDNIFDVWQTIFMKKQGSTVLQSLVRERIREEKEKLGLASDKKYDQVGKGEIKAREGVLENGV
jgi:hypothetical protein